jgi:5'-methylthioadenosine phosphorylase
MKEQVKLAFIGGSGLYELDGMEKIDEIFPDTPWGKPSDSITIGKYDGKLIAFLPRHGKGHFISPSDIPNQANICALKNLGVEEIVAFSAVGSLQEEIAPLHFIVPDQIIDRTKGIRKSTFFENGIVAHASFGDPFSHFLESKIIQASANLPLKLHTKKTLICMEGPLFSTRAESKMYRILGGDIINMSVLPEAKLAREAEIHYQMVCMSTDYDSWREEEEVVTIDMIIDNLHKNANNAKKLIAALIPILGNSENKSLEDTSKYSIITAKEKRNQDQMKKLFQLYGKEF